MGNVPGDAKQQSSSGSSSSQQRPVSSISDQPTSSRATQASTSRKNKPQKGVINTMDSLRKNEEASADDDDDKPAEFYTGGEKSGLGVIDPNPKKASNARDLIQEIVRKAQAYENTKVEKKTYANTNAYLGLNRPRKKYLPVLRSEEWAILLGERAKSLAKSRIQMRLSERQ